MDNAHLEALKRIYGGPMSEQQVELLRDMQAFIDFCIDNGLSFNTAVGTIAHDSNGVLAPDGMFERGIFRPKVHGYQKIVSQIADDATALAADPQLHEDVVRE